MNHPAPMGEMESLTPAAWRECLAGYRPQVLRGLVKDWPVVARGRESPESFCRYLASLDNGVEVDALMLPPEAGGQIGYREDGGFNYLRNKLPLTRVLEQVARYSQFAIAPAVAVQSAPIADCLPGFDQENVLPLAEVSGAPRIWLGNRITTPAHIDESRNLACVVTGRRRFTLFPPAQAPNLYLGPVDDTPTGSPVSVVDSRNPDFVRFPRYQDALAAAEVATLEPGDAIYIPPLWWHQVESLEPLNGLVNYWWKDAGAKPAAGSPFDGLLHSLLLMNGLPAEQREAWRPLFDHFLFRDPVDPAAHLPATRHGVLGVPTAQREAEIRAWLIRRLGDDRG